MTHTAQKPGLLRDLRMLAQAGLVGCVMFGATFGLIDPPNIDTYRTIGFLLAIALSLKTGIYRR